MRARAPFVGTVAVLLLAIASPAAAKLMIAEAHIRGPGLGGGGLRISAPATNGMWESGIDVAGGLDDTRADSIAELRLAVAELGPKYVVTYRFDDGGNAAPEIVRQELYPYAKGGPVTYTPPEQHLAEGRPWGGAIIAGWHQSSGRFFDHLVDQGLPETSPVASSVGREPAPVTLPAARATPWAWIALTVAGLVALSLTAPRLRRRILGVPRNGP
jgi:hypothetical protein